MTTEFVKIDLKNNPATTAELTGHQEIIRNYAEQGYSYKGYVPIKCGPSGKLLTIELVFQK